MILCPLRREQVAFTMMKAWTHIYFRAAAPPLLWFSDALSSDEGCGHIFKSCAQVSLFLSPANLLHVQSISKFSVNLKMTVWFI